MYKIPTVAELRDESIHDNIIDKYCEIIGEEIKKLNKTGVRELRFSNEPESIYINIETNELIVVLSGKKEYANNKLYCKCNYASYVDEVAKRFTEAGYEVKTEVSENRRYCYSTELRW